jgi:ASC-1-like (ASCH) protein
MSKTTTYHKNVSEPWFSLIKTGLKTVEGRLNKGEFAMMKPGDKIVFSNDQLPFPRKFTVKIIGIKKYANFKEYLQKETLPSCLPGIKKLEEGLAIYHMYYTPEDAERFGIVAIKMRI